MSTQLTGNDEIKLTIPSPGGDTDTWDTVQNNNSWPSLAKAAFAAREHRNLAVLGGGAISWNSSTNQVSFTEDIVIRDHITDKTVTVTKAASPVSLSAQNTVAYLEKNRGPTANQSVTSLSTAAPGSLPGDGSGETDDNGVIVLFMRTDEDTLYVPWAMREVLNGDHWQFGAKLSWYERLATHAKPGFFNDGSDVTQVTVPASVATPAVVSIDGKLYVNTSDKVMDVNTSGRNGLDTGTIAADTPYYLYAIPPTSGRGFDVVASATSPSTGSPSGFSSWSYLGSFSTNLSNADIFAFQSRNGRIIFNERTDTTGSTSSTTPVQTSMATVSDTPDFLYVKGRIDLNATGHDFLLSGTNNSTGLEVVQVRSSGTVGANFVFGWVPIFEVRTVYISVSNASASGFADIYGWKEDPMRFK